MLISREEREALLRLREKAKGYDAVISIGIGGSYLGNQVLFDLFCGPYWNQLTKEERKGYPQIYFSGQNVDPVSLRELASCLIKEAGRIADRRMKVLFLVISKSGTTIEPVTAVRGLKSCLLQSAISISWQLRIRKKDESGLCRKKNTSHALRCLTASAAGSAYFPRWALSLPALQVSP